MIETSAVFCLCSKRGGHDLTASEPDFPDFFTSHQLTMSRLRENDTDKIMCLVTLYWKGNLSSTHELQPAWAHLVTNSE